MTRLVLLCGAPGSSLLVLARELDGAAQARVLFPWNLGAALEELGSATRARALAWRGPLGEEQTWIERSLQLAAPALVAALVEREQRARGRIEWLGLGHYALAAHAARLARALPEALCVLVGRDGRVVPRERIASGEPAAQARAGFAWAEQWSRCVGPLVESAEAFGERLVALDEDELCADPAQVKTILLGSRQRLDWRGTRPWMRERLAGAALAGFACSRRARQLQIALGHGPLEPDAQVLALPDLALEFALGALEEGDLARAAAVLPRGRETGRLGARLECARGSLALAEGDRARAADAWGRAIECAPAEPEAWERLFALVDEPLLEDLAPRALALEVPRVRRALARWLVARGLDPEAAEIVARVEHQDWSRAG